MKNILFPILLCSVCLMGTNSRIIDRNITVGMPYKVFKKQFSGASIKGKSDGQWSLKDNLYGLQGKWTYTFKKNSLEWYLFDYYSYDIDRKNFGKCLKAAKNIIKYYTSRFGKPLEIKNGNQKFIDPYKKRHWGYEVIKAVWKTDNEKFQVLFDFFGAKGGYFFLVKIEFQRHDYEYF